jgi:hypothetical protein
LTIHIHQLTFLFLTFAAPINQLKPFFMAFSSTLQPLEKAATPPAEQPYSNVSDALLGMMLLSMYGAQMSKKTVRKLKRRFFLTTLKLKAKAMLPQQRVSDRTLIYIILAAALVALIILAPIFILALAAVVLILYLAGVL